VTRSTAARIWGAATAAIGAAMLARPVVASRMVGAHGAERPNPTIVRVLGGRQLLQGAAVLALPARSFVLIGGSIIDMLHASSMLAASALWPRYRRAGSASAVIAGTSAAAGFVISRRR
jgi:hypothetical protein